MFGVAGSIGQLGSFTVCHYILKSALHILKSHFELSDHIDHSSDAHVGDWLFLKMVLAKKVDSISLHSVDCYLPSRH